MSFLSPIPNDQVFQEQLEEVESLPKKIMFTYIMGKTDASGKWEVVKKKILGLRPKAVFFNAESKFCPVWEEVFIGALTNNAIENSCYLAFSVDSYKPLSLVVP